MSHPKLRLVVALVALAAGVPLARATDLVVTTSTSLPAGTYDYGAVVIQAGATLTLQGNTTTGTGAVIHATSLVIEAGATVKADGQGYASGAGPGAGPVGTYRVGGGGGAYGGNGGSSSGYNAGTGGGTAYGVATDANTLGSGGGAGSVAGGAGGGAIVLTVDGSATINGTLSANGLAGAIIGSDYASGGGSGGSISLEAAQILGSGAIRANGGAGANTSYAYGGGGGGGRIRLKGAVAGTLTVQAIGGTGSQVGGSGTRVVYAIGASSPAWVLDNGARSGAATPVAVIVGTSVTVSGGAIATLGGATTADSLTVIGGSRYTAGGALTLDTLLVATSSVLTHLAGGPGLEIAATGDVTIDGSSRIDVDARGLSGGGGAGPVGVYRVAGGGGGHGGRGGRGTGYNGTASTTSTTQGEPMAATLLGFGGGACAGVAGGNGGGLVHIAAGGTVTIDGFMLARGGGGTISGSDYAGGGGSGGAIAIEAAAVVGFGDIRADGGAGGNTSYAQGGGGAGGRVVIDAPTVLVPATAYGGWSAVYPGATGTVLIKRSGFGQGLLTVKNNGTAAPETDFPTHSLNVDVFTVGNGAQVVIPAGGPVTVRDMFTVDLDGVVIADSSLAAATAWIRSGGRITHATDGVGVVMSTVRDFVIEPAGRIDVDGRGTYSGVGLGLGQAYRIGGSGGSHAGTGGGGNGLNGSSVAGSVTDSLDAPTLLGAAGGGGSAAGGGGGGRIDLTIGTLLRLDGELSADGNNGGVNGSDYAGGGGAGGTIVVRAPVIQGIGRVTANGGAGGDTSYADGGAGSGGRIVLDTPSLAGLTVMARGGVGTAGNGGAGTMLRLPAPGALTMDNGGAVPNLSPMRPGNYTLATISLTGAARLHMPTTAAVTVSGAVTMADANTLLRLDASLTAGSVTLGSGTTLDHTAGTSGCRIVAHGDVTVAAGGAIALDGRGAPGGTGAAVGVLGAYRVGAGGGGHAGLGSSGNGLNGTSSASSFAGDPLTPALLGSGGGTISGAVTGGAGGGAIRIDADGRITLNGTLSANGVVGGVNGSDYASGAGAGGSIDLSAPGGITGTGVISADGGPGVDGTYADGGAGGGGRIRFVGPGPYPSRIARGGTGPAGTGGAGTIWFESSRTLRVDGGGRLGSLATPMPVASYALDRLEIAARGFVTVPAAATLIATDLEVQADGVLEHAGEIVGTTVTVRAAGTIVPTVGSVAAHLRAEGSLTVEATGRIIADSRGSSAASGPGAGGAGGYRVGGGGAGHGCVGAAGGGLNGTSQGGISYDSPSSPAMLGSGGGNGCATGGVGGGRIRISVRGPAHLAGTISAGGGAGSTPSNDCGGGGGAGGSIDLRAATLDGAGLFAADGGAGGVSAYGKGGGGAGGRVAIWAGTSGWAGTARAKGATGNATACDGSIVIQSALPVVSTLTAETGTADGTVTLTWTSPEGLLPASDAMDLRVATTPITDATFAAANPVATPTPSSAGTLETVTASGLVGARRYYFALRVVDAGGRSGVLSNVADALAAGDATPPAAIIDLSASAGPVLTFHEPSDAGTGVVGYLARYHLGNAAFAWADGTDLAGSPPTPVGAGSAQTWIGGFPPGQSVSVVVRAVDGAGNASAVSNRAFVDGVAPTVSIMSPASSSTIVAPTDVVVSATDDVAVIRVTLLVDGAEAGVDVAYPWQITFDPRTVAAGDHTLSARADDAFGNSADASISITTELPAPIVPAILAPITGLSSRISAQDFAVSAQAGDTVRVYRGAALFASAVASGASTRRVEVEAAGNDLGACVLDATGQSAQIDAVGPRVNIALGRPITASAAYSTQFAASEAVDGYPDDGGTQDHYWLAPDGVTNATLTVDLGDVTAIESIRLLNCRNAGYYERSTKDYKLAVSVDGVSYTQVGTGTLIDDDITNWVTTNFVAAPLARYVRFTAVNFYGNGAGLSELQVISSPAALRCTLKTGPVSVAGAAALTSLSASSAANGGAIDLSFATSAPLFTATVTGAVIDDDVWSVSAGASIDAGVRVDGAGAWGNRYAFTDKSFARSGVDEIRFGIKSSSGRAMVGLGRPGAGVNYTNLAYAVYFDGGTLRIYEDGNYRADVGSYTLGSDVTVRFVITSTRVQTWFTAGAGVPVLLRESSFDGGTDFRPGMSVYDGTIRITSLVVDGPNWQPATALAGAEVAGGVRLRAILSRPSLATQSPTIDAFLVGAIDGGTTGGVGVARWNDLVIPDGAHVFTATAQPPSGTEGGSSGPVTVTIDSTPPAAITTLAASQGTAQGEVRLDWTAPGDDAAAGTATRYEVRWSTAVITDANWPGANVVTSPVPKAGGSAETFVIGGLTAGQRTYVAVRAVDDLGNRGGLSNVPSALARDTTVPGVTFASPADLTHVRATTTISASASDNVGVVQMDLLVDGVTILSDSTSPYSFDWNTTTYADGAHTVRVEAVDADGNRAGVTRTLTVDNTVPTVAIAPVNTPTNASVALVVTAADNLTAAGSLVIKDEANRVPPFTYVAEGSYAPVITVTDKAGNSASATRSFIVDLSGPAAVTTLAAAPVITEPTSAQLSWKAPADSLTAVTAYEVRRATSVLDPSGNGADGALVVTSTSSLAPVRGRLSGVASAGAVTVTLAAAAGFQNGHEVLFHVAQCDAAAEAEVGRHTWNRGNPVRVVAAAGTSLTLDRGLPFALDGTQCTVVVQQVPNFTSVRVATGGVLTVPAFDGTSGGLLALRASGNVVVEAGGAINVSALGYRGSGRQCIKNSNGLQGETTIRRTSTRVTTHFRGAGGGGTGGQDSSGGGGGGHGAVGTAGAPYSSKPGGEGGEAVGDAALDKLLLGSAGGQGGADEDGGSPGGGGAGGGVILLSGKAIVVQGSLLADGEAGGAGANGLSGCGGAGCGMGGGGGGAGGVIYVTADMVDVSAGLARANGGAGGATNGCGSVGSVGSVGRVRFDAVTRSGTATPVAYSSSRLTFDWDAATVVSGPPTPGAPGTAESMTAAGLPAGATVYFALRSQNAVGLWSNVSNVAVLDAVPPSVSIVAPTDGDVVTRPTIVVAAAEDDVGVARVELVVDGVLLSADIVAPYEFAWNAPTFGAGVHELVATAFDARGLTGSHTITVTVAPDVPAAPIITSPLDGALVSATSIPVVGRAEAGATVALSVRGVPSGETVAVAASSLQIPANGLTVTRTGCVVAGNGQVSISDDVPYSTNLALASTGSRAYGQTTATAANDGDVGTGTYWSATAAQNENLVYMGRIALSKAAVIGRVKFLLWNGDTRSYYNYKLTLSRDGDDLIPWVDRTGSGLDYAGWQTNDGPPTLARYVDVWLSGNTLNAGAHIIEVEVLPPPTGTDCLLVPPPAPASGALYFGPLAVTGTDGAGQITSEVVLHSDRFVDDFGGVAVNAADFDSKLTTVTSGVATLAATGAWGSAALFTKRIVPRDVVEAIELRVRRDTDGSAMVGLLRPGTSVDYTALAFAIYMTPGAFYIYEDGSQITNLSAVIPLNKWIDLRIEPGATGGAVYRRRDVGLTAWTTLYTSARDGGTAWNVGVTAASGNLSVDRIRVIGRKWVAASSLTGSLETNAVLEVRSRLSRGALGLTSPTLSSWSADYTTGAASIVGAGLFRFASAALVEGPNALVATARDPIGTSAPSPTVTVNVDSGPPSAITNLTATASAAGVVLLQWSEPNEVPAYYTVWRDTKPITTVAGLSPVATGITELSYGDRPTSENTYHYVVTSTDVAGNVSPPSNDAVVAADTAAPRALSISLVPASPVPAGTIAVTLVASEQLAGAPALVVTLPGGVSLPVTLTAGAANAWTGSFVIPVGTATGTGSFAVSLTDLVGNVGTTITAGGTFAIDATPPTVALVLSPASPLKAGNATVTATFSESVIAPTLRYTPSGKSPVTITLSGSGTTYTGAIAITGATGDGPAIFTVSAADLRGNVGTTITSGAAFDIDANAPAAPVLSGVKAPAGYFILTWTETEPGLTYGVRRGPAPCATPPTTLVQTVTTTTTNDVAPVEGLWCYTVAATDAAGNVGPISNTVAIQSDPPPPEDPTALHLVDVADTALEVAFTPSVNSAGLLAGYRAYVNGALVASLPKTAVGYRFTSLQAAKAYTLVISAYDANAKENLGVSLVAHTLVPNPTGVVALGKTARIDVSWNAVAATTSLLQYAVYLSTSPFTSVAGLTAVAANPGGTTATLNNLTNGTTYYVAVTSVNKSNAQPLLVTSVAATPGDNEAPPPPTTFTVTGGTATSLSLAWNAATDTLGDLVGYEILRGGTVALTVPKGTLTGVLSGLTAATAYSLGVRTYDLVGNRSAATALTGYTRMAHPTGVTLAPHNKRIDITWVPPAPLANVDHYAVYALPAAFTDTSAIIPLTTATAASTTASISGLTNGTRYYVAVATVNKSGIEDHTVTTVSAIPVDDAPPEPPTQVRVTQATGSSLMVAWNASANTAGDLANYRVTVGTASPVTQTGTLYTASGLLPARAYSVSVVSVDTLGNVSAPAIATGYTWWPNPSPVSITKVGHGKLTLGWTPPADLSGVSYFAIYKAADPFTSVAGLTPLTTAASSATSALISGLTNGTPVSLAVVTVNKSGSLDPAVASVTGTPVADSVPPAVTSVTYNAFALAAGGTIAVDGTFGATISDEEGVASARFFVDDALIGVDSSPSDGFKAAYALEGVDDGPHTLRVESTDTHGNVGLYNHAFTIALAAPGAPTITTPATGLATNESRVLVLGKARAKSTVRIYVDGVLSGSGTADAGGSFSVLIELTPGTRTLKATASNTGGESPVSTGVVVIYDNTVPEPPRQVTASPREAGAIRVVWYAAGDSSLSGIAGYTIYRSSAPFTTTSGATKLNATPQGELTRTDITPADGTWYYGVTAKNKAGTESVLSTIAVATSDATPPRATLIEYLPHGPVAGARVGVGPVDVRVTFSEALGATPFLSMAASGGLPIPVALSRQTDTLWTGSFDILDETPSGVATAVLSCRDGVNNRGSAVNVGGTLLIDTDAPDVAALVTTPSAPIKNDSQAPVSLQVTITLTEALPDESIPELTWTTSASHPIATPLPLARTSPQTWTGGFVLPTDAGATAESLTFAYTATDDLGNVSTTILGPSSAELYQGTLPPLESPVALVAKALPGGKVKLTWSSPSGAAETEIRRKGPNDQGFSVVTRVSSSPYEEAPGPDGVYQYTVASVRTANGQESLSPPTPPSSVTVDGTPPAPPTSLAALLAKNGIALSWTLSPSAGPLTYTVYRAAGTTITDVSALAPLIEAIPGGQVVDPTPSLTDHAYVVIAVDKAGNRSTVSNTAYLNPGLLPLSSLDVTWERGTFPRLTWTHPRPLSQLAGFRISVNGQDLPDVVKALTFTDTTFDSGSRSYTVRAVDSGGFESPARPVTLPDATALFEAGATIRRRVIDAVPVVVSTDVALTAASIEVRVNGKTFVSEVFTAGPGLGVTVPVVIGGDATLDDLEPVTLTLVDTPEAGTTVHVTDGDTVIVGDDVFGLALETGTFTRGVTGKVRFTFTNSGSADVDLVTALGSGSQGSNEIRAVLTDGDGNALSSAAMRQAVGVLALTNGTVVARVAAGGTFTSDWVTVPVPLGAPDTVNLRLVIDKVHHQVGTPQHAVVDGISSTVALSLIEPPYKPALTSITPALSNGDQPIVLSGNATDTATSGPAANVPVAIIVATGGFERRFDVFTKADGTFSYTFMPLSNEGGIYQAWARHPDVTGHTSQGGFVIRRVIVQPASLNVQLAANYPANLPVQVQTSPGSVLTALRLRSVAVPVGVTLALPASVNVTGGANTALPVTITADNTAPTGSTFSLVVESDEGTWGTIPVTYTVIQSKPVITVTPPGLETGLARGEFGSESLTVGNKGLASFKTMTFSLLNGTRTGAGPSWASISSALSLDELAVGQSHLVSLAFTPSATVPLTTTEPVTIYLRIKAQGLTVADVPVYVWINDSGLGAQVVKVSDIYTGTTGTNGQVVQGVSGATVELTKTLGSPYTVKKTTDATGEVLFQDLPVGTYKYRVAASGHPASGGTLVVKAGVTGSTEVFLSTDLVSIEWSVKETTIEDKYTIVLQATFETEVPAAVVTIEPASVTIPDGMSVGQSFTGQLKITNHGLIKAEDVLPTLPTSPDYKFELQGALPTVLAAKQVVTVGYRVTRLTPDPDGVASGGGCVGVAYPMKVCYGYKCINGTWAKDCNTFYWTRVYGVCTGGSGTTIPWTPYTPYNVGVSTGTSTGTGYTTGISPSKASEPVPGSPGCDPCEHPDLSSAEKDCCKKNKSQPASSTVDLITGRYEDDATDMTVGILGHDLQVARYFYEDAWHLRFFDANLTLIQTSGTLTKVSLLGVTYAAADSTGTVFKDGKNANTVVVTQTGFEWTDRNANVRRFDATGRLTEYGDRNGRLVKLVYDGSGKLTGLKDTVGSLVVTYAYDASGHVQTIRDVAGDRSVTYAWTGDRLTGVTNVLGQSTTFSYNSAGKLVTKRYATGKVTTISYASTGVVMSVLEDSGKGIYLDYGYNATTQQNYASVLGTDGSLREKWFDKNGRVVQEMLNGSAVPKLDSPGAAVIDTAGNVAGGKNLDGQVAEQYQYGSYGLITRHVSRRGIVTTRAYDAAGNLTEEIVGVGRADARRITFTYDSHGLRLTETHHGGAAGDLTWQMTYDPRGNVASIVGPGGAVTTRTWNSFRALLTEEAPDGTVSAYAYDKGGRRLTSTVTPPGGTPMPVESWAYSTNLDGTGLPVGERKVLTDVAGRTTTTNVDSLGRTASVIDHYGRATRFEYDARDRVVTERHDDGYTISFSYEDLAGAKTRATQRDNDVVTRVVDRDAYGRITRQVVQGVELTFIYDGGFRLPVQIQRPGLTEVLAYDAFENVTSRTYIWADGESVTETYGWEGSLQTSFSNSKDGGFVRTMDVQGREVSRTYAEGITQRLERDAFGRITGFFDGRNSRVVNTEFNGASQVGAREFAGGLRVVNTYDATGRAVTSTGSDGVELRHTYDALGREVGVGAWTSGATTPAFSVTKSYDLYRRLTSISSGAFSTAITWDDAARTRTETTNFGPFSKSLSYRVDSLGRKVGYTGPDGVETTFTYAPDGRLASVTRPTMGTVTMTHPAPYDTTITYPSGVVVRTESAARMRTKRIRADKGLSSLFDLQYQWSAHQLASQTVAGVGTTSFTYDDADQVTGATYPTQPPDAFTYDASGNRLTSAALPGAWAADAANRLTAIGTSSTFAYDAHGNVTAWTSPGHARTFEWNPVNHLERVTDNGIEVARYAYDGRGWLARRDTGGSTTFYQYSDEGLAAEFDGTGALVRAYLWEPDTAWQAGLVAQQVGPAGITAGGSPGFVFPVLDRTGTVERLTDAAGAVVWSAQRRAFLDAVVDPSSTVETPLRGSSQRAMPESGLHYNGMRWYVPALGRYLSTDPLFGLLDRTNAYEFADNNPVIVADRNGADQGAGMSIGTDGSVSGTFNTTRGPGYGAYWGWGGEVQSGVEFTRKDCCKEEPGKPAVLIKNGEMCAVIKIGVEGGFGIGKPGPVGGAIKLGTVGTESSCSLCNKCGEAEPNLTCCQSFTVKIGSVSASLWYIQLESTLFNYEYKVCLSADGFKGEGTPNWFQGKSGFGFTNSSPAPGSGHAGGPAPGAKTGASANPPPDDVQ